MSRALELEGYAPDFAPVPPCYVGLARGNRGEVGSVALQHAAAGRPIDSHTKEKAVHPISSTRKSLQSVSGSLRLSSVSASPLFSASLISRGICVICGSKFGFQV